MVDQWTRVLKYLVFSANEGISTIIDLKWSARESRKVAKKHPLLGGGSRRCTPPPCGGTHGLVVVVTFPPGPD